jgi:hypothetical protein
MSAAPRRSRALQPDTLRASQAFRLGYDEGFRDGERAAAAKVFAALGRAAGARAASEVRRVKALARRQAAAEAAS